MRPSRFRWPTLALSLVLIAFGAGRFGLAAQQQQPASGAISGVVLDATTGQPIAGAVVMISIAPATAASTGTGFVAVGAPVRVPRQITDELGRFVFPEIPGGGSYTLSTTKSGYFGGAYGRRGQAGVDNPPRPVSLATGQWLRDIRIEMLRFAAITGTVRNETGEPMVGVSVRAYADIFVAGARQLALSRSGLTDDRGEYRLEGLPPGKFLVAVPSTQHAAPADLTTAAPEYQQDALNRSYIGRPVPAIAFDPIHRLLLAQDGPPLPQPSGGRRQMYPTTFHPAARLITDATPIEIVGGDEKTAIDVQLRPAPGFRVSGTLDGAADAVSGMSLRLMSAGTESMGRGLEQATALVAGDGTFTFLNVPPGTYTLIANRAVSQYSYFSGGPAFAMPLGRSSTSTTSAFGGPPGTMVMRAYSPGSMKYQGRQQVVVGAQDVTGVVVPMQAGVSISGRIIYDSIDPERMAAVSTVTAEPADGDLAAGQPRFVRDPNEDDTTYFFIESVLPGLFLLRTTGGGTLKSVTWSDRDYSDRPIEIEAGKNITGIVITVTDRLTTLSGTVRNRTGQPAAGAGVVMFPADRALWKNFGNQPRRLRYLTTSTTGTYMVRGLPAGDYLAVAVEETSADRWQDPSFLEIASRTAVRFSLNWSETTTLDVTVQAIR